MKSLVIAEKPSVARDIARVLHCNQNGNGILEGKEYVVTWALGHLVTLADPEEYDKKYVKWDMETLPMMPEEMKLVVIRQTSKQYQAVKAQLFRKDIGDIIIATDAGREGELVARWILDKSGCRKPIRRLWISSVTDKAIRWMKEADKDRPFMMCCHFKATHEPWDFPERMRHLYDGVVFPEPENLFDWGPETNGRTFSGQPLEELARRWDVASQDPDKWWCRYPELPFTTKGMHRSAARSAAYQKLVRDYLRCGATIDDNIGKLLKALDDMGIDDNTIVVYVSDQGYFLGEHGFFDKRMMYEESLRMPFVIRYPKEIPAGTRNKDMILNVDFASLLADYAGVKTPNESQGHSFRDNLKGNTPKDWRKEMYYRYWTQHSNRPAHMGIRNERYKLMFFYGDRLNMTGSEDKTTTPAWEFYDLQSDPRENHNAYNDPQYAKIIRQMKEEMLKLRKDVKDEDTNTPKMKEIMDTYYW